MNAPLRRRPAAVEPEPEGRIGRFLSERRAGLGGLLVIGLAAVAGWAIWSLVGDRVRSDAAYLLLPEAIELRGVATWAPAGLKAEALRDASLDRGLPLDDPELTNRLARAFDMHPWVKQVVRVELRAPAAALVEIICREPAAMVGVEGGLLAVDAEGVVLPSAGFTAEAAVRYPRISGVRSSPQGPEGSSWGDAVVEEGAALAVVVGPEWQKLGLRECRPIEGRGGRLWQLVGPDDRTILFGSAPGRERAGESAAARKVAALREAAAGPPTAVPTDLTVVGTVGDAGHNLPEDGPKAVPTIPSP